MIPEKKEFKTIWIDLPSLEHLFQELEETAWHHNMSFKARIEWYENDNPSGKIIQEIDFDYKKFMPDLRLRNKDFRGCFENEQSKER